MGPLPPTALLAAAAVWLRPLNGFLAAPNAAQIAAAELLPRTFFSLVLVVLAVLVVLGALVVLAVLVALAIFFSELVSERLVRLLATFRWCADSRGFRPPEPRPWS